MIDAFNQEVPVMFSTYGAGGYALHLPGCNNIIFYSQTFDYKDKIQSLDCVYQKGQNHLLNIYNFWVQTGLENSDSYSLVETADGLKEGDVVIVTGNVNLAHEAPVKVIEN